MLLKLTGALLLIFATGSTGCAIARGLGDRVTLLEELQSLLQFLITEIDFALTPFPDALSKSGHALGSTINAFVGVVLTRLGEGKALTAAWTEGVTELAEHTVLRLEDVKPLIALSPVLGLSDRKDQLRHLQLALEHLRQRQRLAETEAERNQKLWRYSGVLVGLALVILLI